MVKVRLFQILVVALLIAMARNTMHTLNVYLRHGKNKNGDGLSRMRSGRKKDYDH